MVPRHTDQKLRAIRIISGPDERHIGREALIMRHGFDRRVARSRKKERVQPMRAPLGLEPSDKECPRQSANRRDVSDVRTTQVSMPLWIVIPHRVRLSIDYRDDGFGIQGETLRQKNEIRTKALRLPPCPPLSE